MADTLSRLKLINSVSATTSHIYVVCGETQGYGYAVYRLTSDLTEPKKILGNLSGCCGQMDVQVRGEELYVALNTQHAVYVCSTEGKLLRKFGKRGTEGSADGFGSCCNPMNVNLAEDGTVYTAESEGYIKAFAADGTCKGQLGHARISGGCKNVALAVSKDGSRVYFCDQPGSRIIILERKEAASE